MKDYHYKITFLYNPGTNEKKSKIFTLPIELPLAQVIYQFEEDYYKEYGQEIMVTAIEKIIVEDN